MKVAAAEVAAVAGAVGSVQIVVWGEAAGRGWVAVGPFAVAEVVAVAVVSAGRTSPRGN